MPDDSWNKNELLIPPSRPVDIFIPNVNSMDLDTTGTSPFGLLGRPGGDSLSVDVLDMSATFNRKRYHAELLNDPAI